MKSGLAATLTAATVCILFSSTGGILLWCLVQMAVSLFAAMVEFFEILPQHWAEGNRFVLAVTSGVLTVPIVAWFGFRLFVQALRIERTLRAGT